MRIVRHLPLNVQYRGLTTARAPCGIEQDSRFYWLDRVIVEVIEGRDGVCGRLS